MLLKMTSLSAVLITGGSSSGSTAELYFPLSLASCTLPLLPDDRSEHTAEKTGLLCGGATKMTMDSCVQWNFDTGIWEQSLTLDIDRRSHVSWSPEPYNGTFLIGGSGDGLSTTLIKPDGSQVPGFSLDTDTDWNYNIRYVIWLFI